ncbi:MAG: leucine-rich repeat protein [Oscillospiraceae bacterium]|nr:leucine-rich repeat protein [Oscillospiraceae bacterium]
MNSIKRTAAFLICSCMLIALTVCQSVSAQTKTEIGAKNITGYEAGKGYDYIYLGKNDSQAIKWRVLSSSGNATGATDALKDDNGDSVDNNNSFFIMSEEVVDVYANQKTNNKKLQNQNFQGSLLQDWCKSIIDGSHASIVLADVEKKALLNTTKDDEELEKTLSANTYKFLGVAKELTDDKLFLLSANELINPQYGFSEELAADDNRIAKWNNTESFWLLRQPPCVEAFPGMTVSVTTIEGGVMLLGTSVEDYGLRPAANLYKEDILFASAAEGGKGNFEEVTENTSHEWKLTLKDGNSFADGADIASTKVAPGKEIVITHKKLSEISADYTDVTAAISDKGGNLLYYGSVDTDTNATETKIKVPSGLADGTYTLTVYGEDWNPDKFTDYATGTPFETEITVESAAADEGTEPGKSDTKPSITVAVKKGTKFTVKGYKYTVTSNLKKKPAVTVTGYKNKKLKKINVPATVTYKKVKFKVTAIGKSAFKNQKKATAAVIGKNVETIGANAFAGGSKSKKITVKSTVLKKVGAKALKAINKKAVIKVPPKKKKAYKKLFNKKGQAKTVKIK